MENGGGDYLRLPDYYNEVMRQLGSMSLYQNGESLNAGESSSRVYLNTLDGIYDHPPTRRFTLSEEVLPYPPNVQYRTAEHNPNFASTSSSPYNNFLVNSHNPDEILPQKSYGNTEPVFGTTFSIQHTAPYNPIPLSLNRDSQMIDQTILDLISDPISLYECACSGPEFIEGLIMSLRDFQSVLLCLVISLAEVLVALACNSIGKRVIMKCFVDVGLIHRNVLASKIVQYCLALATDKYGCIFLNECMPLMEETYKEDILFIICNHALFLAQHCYGTYVVQEAVSKQHLVFTPMIVRKVTCMFHILATQKQGSHLVEKCILSCLTREIAVDALMELESAQLHEMACNEFGNFVLQKALTSTKEPVFLHLHFRLRKALLPLAKELKRDKFGRNVAMKLQNGSNRC